MLSPFVDKDRVGGCVDKVVMTYDTKHPVILPYKYWVSHLVQHGHSAVAATVAKVRKKYWILQAAHDLAKRIKFQCAFCREMEHKSEVQVIADLPECRLALHTPPFYFCLCNYFGPYQVKISHNRMTKHYGVIFTCLNTRAVHSAQSYLQVLPRFFALKGQPKSMLSDNTSQLVGAERELREMIQGWEIPNLREFCAERGMEWRFTTHGAPHQNSCADALVKSCKYALKKAIGNQVFLETMEQRCLPVTSPTKEVERAKKKRPGEQCRNDG